MYAVPQTKEAFKLFMDGEEALTRASINGMKVDVAYMKTQKPEIIRQCEELKVTFLDTTNLGQSWVRKYGTRADIDSPSQMVEVLKTVGFDKFKTTAKGNLSTDKSVIEKLPYDESSLLLKRNQLKTLWQNLLAKSIIECDQYGFIHPNFNLHKVRTFRGSCDGPNLQNQPKHNEMQKNIIRRAFLPRTADRMLMELDLRGNEVSCGCSIHHDANMLRFLSDATADMHKEVGMHYWMAGEDIFTKDLRKSVKGPFVFAGFYGAGADSMAHNLWEWANEKNPTLKNDVKLLDHLKGKGINTFDDILEHTKKEYEWFWFDLFKSYGEWKEDQWELYKKQGFLDYPTGFRVIEKMLKTQAINTVIQGSSFHVLLASLIELQRRFDKYKMQSLIIGQIHDSVIIDAVANEVQMIYDMYLESQDAVRKRWQWIVYPIVVEADLGAPGAPWSELKEQGPITHGGTRYAA